MKTFLRSFANLQVDLAVACRLFLFVSGAVAISVCIDDEVGGKIIGWVAAVSLSLAVVYLLLRLLVQLTVGLKDKDEKPKKSNPQTNK